MQRRGLLKWLGSAGLVAPTVSGLWADGQHSDTRGLQSVLDDGGAIPAGGYAVDAPLIVRGRGVAIHGCSIHSAGTAALIVENTARDVMITSCILVGQMRVEPS